MKTQYILSAGIGLAAILLWLVEPGAFPAGIQSLSWSVRLPWPLTMALGTVGLGEDEPRGPDVTGRAKRGLHHAHERFQGDHTMRGQVVAADGSSLPKELALQMQITGPDDSTGEGVAVIEIDPTTGKFQFDVDDQAMFVRFFCLAEGFAPLESGRLTITRDGTAKSIQLELTRGFTATIHLKTAEGIYPTSGVATVSLRNSFRAMLGVFAISDQGHVRIPHSMDGPVQIDLHLPGFEEHREYLTLRRDRPNEILIRPAQPVRLRVLSAVTGQPIGGAEVRLFSRVRANSFRRPLIHFDEAPVWGVSDANGEVMLTTLRAIDPVPSIEPGAAAYAFRIDAPNHATRYVGDVRAGNDLGDIWLHLPLSVSGELGPAAPESEPFSVLGWRQSTVSHAGDDIMTPWRLTTLGESDGRRQFVLTDLRSGRLDLLVGFSDPSELADRPERIRIRQTFSGMLSANSSGLKITGDAVEPGDEHFQETSSLRPDGIPHSNVSPGIIEELSDHLLFAWSYLAPAQRTQSRLEWRLIVLQDGTLFVPSAGPHDAGVHCKLSPAAIQELTSFLDGHAVLFGTEAPTRVSPTISVHHSLDVFEYVKMGRRKTFRRWHGRESRPATATDGPQQQIEDYLHRLITEVNCGGRQELAEFRDMANQALAAEVDEAQRFTAQDWCRATIHPDGTRYVSFGNKDARLQIMNPLGGTKYIEYIEFQGQPVKPRR